MVKPGFFHVSFLAFKKVTKERGFSDVEGCNRASSYHVCRSGRAPRALRRHGLAFSHSFESCETCFCSEETASVLSAVNMFMYSIMVSFFTIQTSDGLQRTRTLGRSEFDSWVLQWTINVKTSGRPSCTLQQDGFAFSFSLVTRHSVRVSGQNAVHAGMVACLLFSGSHRAATFFD